jgi:hypothetical protein
MGTTLAITGGTVAGLITAGRRECWGSQTSGAGGHRNNAVPFCFVLVTFPATTTLTSAALPEESQRHQASSAPGSRYCRRVSADRSKRFCNRRGASSANPDCSHCQQQSESRLQRRRLADVVPARVIVPANPPLADLEGATNVAARLGYETTALTLPVVVRDSDVGQPAPIAVPILVGRENRFVKRLADAIRRATGSGRTVSACMYQPGDLEGHRDLL